MVSNNSQVCSPAAHRLRVVLCAHHPVSSPSVAVNLSPLPPPPSPITLRHVTLGLSGLFHLAPWSPGPPCRRTWHCSLSSYSRVIFHRVRGPQLPYPGVCGRTLGWLPREVAERKRLPLLACLQLGLGKCDEHPRPPKRSHREGGREGWQSTACDGETCPPSGSSGTPAWHGVRVTRAARALEQVWGHVGLSGFGPSAPDRGLANFLCSDWVEGMEAGPEAAGSELREGLGVAVAFRRGQMCTLVPL